MRELLDDDRDVMSILPDGMDDGPHAETENPLLDLFADDDDDELELDGLTATTTS